MNEEDLIEEAKNAHSVEELIKEAGEEGIELSRGEAETAFEELHKRGELSDDEVEDVTGGGCSSHLATLKRIFNIGSNAIQTIKDRESEKKK